MQNDTIGHLTDASVVTKPSPLLAKYIFRRSIGQLDIEIWAHIF